MGIIMKKNKNNFEFIKNKFESEAPEAPASLSENEIKNKIEGKEAHKIIKIKKRFPIKAVASCAACFVLVFALLTSGILKTGTGSAEPNEIQSFKSYDEIEGYVSKINRISLFSYGNLYGNLKGDNLIAEESPSSDGGSSSSHAETYRQVENVDEADIIKTDGEYIYYAYNSSVYIYRANGDEPYQTGVIDIDDNGYISEMYLADGILTVIYDDYTYSQEEDFIQGSTVAQSFDVSAAESPREISSYNQSGYYSSSRMIDGRIYLITGCYLYDSSQVIPSISENSKTSPIPCTDIYYTGRPSTASYTVVSAFNPETGEKTASAKAFFGGADEVYCNESNLYITSFESASNDIAALYRADSLSFINNGKTHIIKIALGENELKITAKGEVSGTVNNQFSLDEYDGYLRIAVTDYSDDSGESESAVYILDENLEEMGSITGIAQGEHIEAVRFAKETAYVITYEQTDPLFVIDLSNPKEPKMLGSVEITGFSSMLIPLENGRILGIGFETEQGEYGEVRSGIKLVLFDASSPAEPKIISTQVLDGFDSEAQYTHKAIAVNNEKGYYAIPVNFYDSQNQKTGVAAFTVENDEIKITNTFINNAAQSYSYTQRCTFAGDYVYSIALSNAPQIFAYHYE